MTMADWGTHLRRASMARSPRHSWTTLSAALTSTMANTTAASSVMPLSKANEPAKTRRAEKGSRRVCFSLPAQENGLSRTISFLPYCDCLFLTSSSDSPSLLVRRAS